MDEKKAVWNSAEKLLETYLKVRKQMPPTGLDPKLKLAMIMKGTKEEYDLKTFISLMTELEELIRNIPEKLLPSYFCVYCGEEKEACSCEVHFFIQGNSPRDEFFKYCRSRPVCSVCSKRSEFHKFGRPCEGGRFFCYELPISVSVRFLPAH